MGMNEDLQKQLVNDLLIESFEGLDQFDHYLLELEKGEGGSETLNSIFRVIHTIKGTSGCIGLNRIEKLAHVGENLLSLLRENKLDVKPEMITALLQLSDGLRGMLRTLEASGNEGATDFSELIELLNELQEPGIDAAVATRGKKWGLFGDDAAAVAAAAEAETAAISPEPAPAPVTVVSSSPATSDAAAPKSAEAAGPRTGEAAAGRSSIADTAIRVDVGQLDKLMNLVGELVLARNQIIQHSSNATEDGLAAASQRLNIITTELQESVMKTRMQPIGNVWSKFPRVVRDLAGELGKNVHLVMEGNETELDRTILEAIKDPLTHIVRNSVDHGIETPAKRREKGKPDQGTLVMRAFHEGGQVIMEIRDDGRGIDTARVLQKAVQRGLLTQERASRLTERETFHLIFAPGFSTAEAVTNVSGRGVGMDVVKTNIEKIGGSVDVHSEADRGTTIRIKIPLTLAIIPALIVSSGGDRFAIPQVSLLELVRLNGDQARGSVETIYGAPVFRLRGHLLPLVHLNRELQLGGDESEVENVNIVVLQADGRPFGLVVDTINDTEEIVVKPMGKTLKNLTHFAGATIMGDGRVALILDVLGLAQRAHLVSEHRDRELAAAGASSGAGAGDQQTLLVFAVGDGGRMAIPLSLVARLEEFPRSKIEYSGGQPVVQYRNQILPLVPVERFVPGGRADQPLADPMQVVVYTSAGHSVGLVVGRIQDIVQESLTITRKTGSPGVLGSVVVQNQVTDLLDVEGIIQAADACAGETAAQAA